MSSRGTRRELALHGAHRLPTGTEETSEGHRGQVIAPLGGSPIQKTEGAFPLFGDSLVRSLGDGGVSRAHKDHHVCRSVRPSVGSAAQQETGWGQLQSEPRPRLDASLSRVPVTEVDLGPASPAATVPTGPHLGEKKAWPCRRELCPAEGEQRLYLDGDSARDDNS